MEDGTWDREVSTVNQFYLHRDFAHALGARIGPSGGRRTQRAATSHRQSVKRFFLLMDQLPWPPGGRSFGRVICSVI
ncbi:hypothetical protein [Streptomyces fagopyri]|uniref:hypothetical protein n=1 Tax=Streptomyces fagopyri TaxID=2662397 RepID=UPI0033CDF738